MVIALIFLNKPPISTPKVKDSHPIGTSPRSSAAFAWMAWEEQIASDRSD